MDESAEWFLALSMNCNSYPSIFPREGSGNHHRFGISCYSLESYYATLLKNLPPPKSYLHLNEILYEGKNSGYAVFLCAYQIAKFHQSNMQPFRWTLAGRAWSMIGKAELDRDYQKHYVIGKRSLFNPIGTSEEEYLFCWLLQLLSSKNSTSLLDLGWEQLHEILLSFDRFGSIELMLSDGQDLVFYSSKNSSAKYSTFRSCPPRKSPLFEFDRINVHLDALDLNHNFISFTNQSLLSDQKEVNALQPSQMVVARQAEYIWDSHSAISKLKEADFQTYHYHTQEELTHTKISPETPLLLNSIVSKQISTSKENESGSISTPPVYIYTTSDDPNPAIYFIEHQNEYTYESPVQMSKHLFRLQPMHDLTQSVLHYRLTISSDGKACNFLGAFGNQATTIDIATPYTVLQIKSSSLVVVSDLPKQRYDLLHQQWTMPLIWMPWDSQMLQAYLTPTELTEGELIELSEYAMSFAKRNNNDVIEVLNDINRTIYSDYSYVSGSTTLATTPYEVYVNRHGVCQDFANLFICLSRLLNIPARYRVGYIYTGLDYDNKQQGDASHAWVELYLPNIGWVGFDPTNNCPQNKHHIRVASGRHYRDSTPTSGTIYKGGGGEKMSVFVKVTKIEASDLADFLRELP